MMQADDVVMCDRAVPTAAKKSKRITEPFCPVFSLLTTASTAATTLGFAATPP
jgi:hypothetical protein